MGALPAGCKSGSTAIGEHQNFHVGCSFLHFNVVYNRVTLNTEHYFWIKSLNLDVNPCELFVDLDLPKA